MATYVVMERGLGRGAETEFVRDGFAWLGLIVPFLWLLWHRLWIEAIVLLAASLGLGVLAEQGGAAGVIVPLVSFLLALFVGLDGAALRIAALRRRGWREWGVVEGGSFDEAEARYIIEGGVTDDVSRPPPAAPATPAPSRREVGPALGLLDYPAKG